VPRGDRDRHAPADPDGHHISDHISHRSTRESTHDCTDDCTDDQASKEGNADGRAGRQPRPDPGTASGDGLDRYAIAHLAALRAAAAVLAARARPTRGRRGSVWTLMTQVAPEFTEWAAFFAAGSAKRQAVQAGLPAGVSPREADDLVRQVVVFISLVGESIEQPAGH
jgi:hypothetical protein